MPAGRFTKKATTAKDSRMWDHVYKSAKSRGDSPAAAIKQANAAVKKGKKK